MYLINQVAAEVGLSQKRVREYEKEGFIRPARQERTNNRLYSDFDVAQIKRINYLLHERGFTVACLKELLRLAPCWRIFDCLDPTKCPAYHQPHKPCYEVRQEQDTPCPGPCGACAVFLNREHPADRVLEPNHRAEARAR